MEHCVALVAVFVVFVGTSRAAGLNRSPNISAYANFHGTIDKIHKHLAQPTVRPKLATHRPLKDYFKKMNVTSYADLDDIMRNDSEYHDQKWATTRPHEESNDEELVEFVYLNVTVDELENVA